MPALVVVVVVVNILLLYRQQPPSVSLLATTTTTASSLAPPTPSFREDRKCHNELAAWETCVLESHNNVDLQEECRSCSRFYLDLIVVGAAAAANNSEDQEAAAAAAAAAAACQDNADLVCAASRNCYEVCNVQECLRHVEVYATCVLLGEGGCSPDGCKRFNGSGNNNGDGDGTTFSSFLVACREATPLTPFPTPSVVKGVGSTTTRALSVPSLSSPPPLPPGSVPPTVLYGGGSSSDPSPWTNGESSSPASSDRPSIINAEEETFPSVSPRPSQTTVPPAQLASAQCEDAIADLAACVSYNAAAEAAQRQSGLAGACAECFQSYAEAVPTVVCGKKRAAGEAAESEARQQGSSYSYGNRCSAFGACPGCDGCYPQRMQYTDCLYQYSTNNCDDDDTYQCYSVDAACYGALDTFATCIESSPPWSGGVAGASATYVTTCLECLTLHMNKADETCVASEYYTCGAIEQCPECGSNCGTELAALQDCRMVRRQQPNDCEPIDCYSNTSDENDGCDARLVTLRSCLVGSSSSGSSNSRSETPDGTNTVHQCEACVAYALDAILIGTVNGFEAPPCSTINDEVCIALVGGVGGGGNASCQCGSCVDEYVSFLNCRLDEVLPNAGCAIVCYHEEVVGGPAPAPTAPSSPSTSSANAPAGRAGQNVASVVLVALVAALLGDGVV